MPPDSPALFSSQGGLLSFIVLIVTAMHLLLLGMGTFWHPSLPHPKPRSTLVVQTVHLKPLESPAPSPLGFHPGVPPSPILSASSIKTEPMKIEGKPAVNIPLPGPVLQDASKPSAPTSAPVKKAIESAKQSTKHKTVVPQGTEEREKKERQERAKAEKMDQQKRADAEKRDQQKRADAEKMDQQKRADAEKRDQQKRAEAERKRQRELTALQETARQREEALLAKANETFAKMEETRDKMTSFSLNRLEIVGIPKELGLLQVDLLLAGEGETPVDRGLKEVTYRHEVAHQLKMALKLPDYGAVDVEITLNRTGKVVKVGILRSESNKNKHYVEETIPTLFFPSFGQQFEGKLEHVFRFTLQNR